jgi:ribosomal-protein-alanine N-acetyltransferase
VRLQWPTYTDGTVEIAYANAAELTRLAFADLRVCVVCAHTLPEHNASTRVLQKLGLRFVGLANDANEGTVWRWELARAGIQQMGPVIVFGRRIT